MKAQAGRVFGEVLLSVIPGSLPKAPDEFGEQT